MEVITYPVILSSSLWKKTRSEGEDEVPMPPLNNFTNFCNFLRDYTIRFSKQFEKRKYLEKLVFPYFFFILILSQSFLFVTVHEMFLYSLASTAFAYQ